MQAELSGCRIIIAVGAVALAVCSAPRAAGVVTTSRGRHDGRVSVRNGALLVDGRRIQWTDVLSVVTDRERTVTSPNALRLRNGELWFGRVLRLSGHKLNVRLEPFGEHEIDLQLIASIEFYPRLAGAAPGRDEDRDRKKGRLYRTKGRSPITGELTGISEGAVRIKSTLGRFNLPRSGVLRYVFDDVGVGAEPAASAKAGGGDVDELGIVNGGVYRGEITPEGDLIRLRHPVLGTVFLSIDALRYVLRRSESWTCLAARPWRVVSNVGPLSSSPPPRRQRLGAGHDGRTVGPPRWVEAIRMSAGSSVRFFLPPRPRGGRFSSIVHLADGVVSSGILRAKASGETVSEQRVTPRRLTPGHVGLTWSFTVPAADSLELSFDFDERVQLPCTVVIGDPVIVW